MNTTSLAYFPRQLRDTLVTRGAAMVVIAVLMTLPIWMIPLPEEVELSELLRSSLRGMGAFLIMVATYGIIGEDIRRGYFRFLFSKQINPVIYYAQAFLAALIAFIAAQLVVVGISAVILGPVWPDGWWLDSITGFVLFGALIFAVSRFTRLDWLVGLFIFVMSQGIRDWYPPEEYLRGKVFNVLFPPGHLLESTLFPADGIAWAPMAWVGGYAAVCLAIGLSVVRWVPLGTQR